MAREKKTVHKVQMTEGKRNIIHQLLEGYGIRVCEENLLMSLPPFIIIEDPSIYRVLFTHSLDPLVFTFLQ